MTDADAKPDKLEKLGRDLPDLASDLRVLRGLLKEDTQSALNKMRFVVERALHDLSKTNDVSWGKQEPTVENMIGPLVAAKVIPRNVAIHVRTVQTNASPGSHFQEAPLDDAHVEVAKLALVQFLEWYRSTKPEAAASPATSTDDAALAKTEVAVPRSTGDASVQTIVASAVKAEHRRPPYVMIGAALALVGGAAWFVGVRQTPAPGAGAPTTPSAAMGTPDTTSSSSAAPAGSLREPTVGLRAIEAFRRPTGKDTGSLVSQAYWLAAARDLEVASAQPGAPKRWLSAHLFAKAQAQIAKGDYTTAEGTLWEAIRADADWSVPHAGLATALSRLGRVDEALHEAREAERLDAEWTGGAWTAARVYAHASRFDDAIQEYQRALRTDEKNGALLGDLAICYHGAHMDSEAQRYATRALDADPELASVHLMLAELAIEADDGKKALEHASRAVAILPTSASARLAEADAYALMKDAERARYAYEKAVSLFDELGGSGEIAGRLTAVRASLKKGELPNPRDDSAYENAPGSDGNPQVASSARPMPKRSPRTACSPGDPLCGSL